MTFCCSFPVSHNRITMVFMIINIFCVCESVIYGHKNSLNTVLLHIVLHCIWIPRFVISCHHLYHRFVPCRNIPCVLNTCISLLKFSYNWYRFENIRNSFEIQLFILFLKLLSLYSVSIAVWCCCLIFGVTKSELFRHNTSYHLISIVLASNIVC